VYQLCSAGDSGTFVVRFGTGGCRRPRVHVLPEHVRHKLAAHAKMPIAVEILANTINKIKYASQLDGDLPLCIADAVTDMRRTASSEQLGPFVRCYLKLEWPFSASV
jgi:hypothetical protein